MEVKIYDIYIEHAKITPKFIELINKASENNCIVYGFNCLDERNDNYRFNLRFSALGDINASIIYHDVLKVFNRLLMIYGVNNIVDGYIHANKMLEYFDIDSSYLEMTLKCRDSCTDLIYNKYKMINSKYIVDYLYL